MVVTSKVKNVIDWCSQNISEQQYYLPSVGYLRVGGVGWEVAISGSGNSTELRCKDEALGTFLALKFGIAIKIKSLQFD